LYEGAYLNGVIAGKMSKTKTLGFIASFPVPEVIRNINAFTLGAQSVNPAIKTKVIWVNSWYDPAKERQAAETLVAQGADVMRRTPTRRPRCKWRRKKACTPSAGTRTCPSSHPKPT
jgi:basic membrane lipoprotein Med (substrate-binding protein (PBP1-ABC) superfamily)